MTSWKGTVRNFARLDKAKAILLLAFTLRIYRLGDKNIWWDEGLAVWAVRKGLSGVTLWTASDVHPPLYFWCLWAWRHLVGESEFALRYLTLMFGVLTVAALYPLSRRLADRRVALLGTFLLAMARFHVWWSQEMRMYVLAGLMITLAWYFLLRAAPPNPLPFHEGGWRGALHHWSWYILTAAASLYTIYLSIASLIAQSLFVLAVGLARERRERWGLWGGWAVAQLAVLLLFVPWLALALPRMQSWSVTQTPVSLKFVIQLTGTLFTLGISTNLERYVWLVLPFAAICLMGLALLLGQGWRKVSGLRSQVSGLRSQVSGLRSQGRPEFSGRQAAVLFLLALGLPTLSAWLLSQPRAIFYTPRIEARYFLPFAALFYLLLGWSLLLIMRKSRALGLLGLAFVTAAFAWTLPQHYEGRYLRDELQTMVRAIWAYAHPGDAVLLVSGDRYPIFHYYYDRDPAPDHRPPVYGLPRRSQTVTPEVAALELEPLVMDHPRLWLASVEAAIQDPQGLLEGWLDRHRVSSLSLAFGHNKLKLYTEAPIQPTVPPDNLAPQYPPLPIPPRSAGGDLAQGVRLWGYDLPVREYGPGDVVRLALYWSLSQPVDVALALMKEPGQLWEERQVTLQPIEGDILRTQLDFTIWPRSPRGHYYFVVRLQADPSVADPSSHELALGRFRVRDTEPLPEVTVIPNPMSVHLGDGISFLGYGLQKKNGSPGDRAWPGDVLVLDLYWQAREKVSQRYTVFTHLVSGAYNPRTQGPVWAQHDGEPVDEGLPTHQWPVGTVVKDSHELEIDPAAPAGEYWLEVGMYLLASGERLPALGEDGQAVGDRVLLQSLQIARP